MRSWKTRTCSAVTLLPFRRLWSASQPWKQPCPQPIRAGRSWNSARRNKKRLVRDASPTRRAVTTLRCLSLAVDLSEHNIQTAHNGHRISHERPLANRAQGTDGRKTWGTSLAAKRFLRAITDDIKTDFPT